MNVKTRAGPARINSYHGTKRQLLGNQAGHAAPAWRNSNLPASGPSGINGHATLASKKLLEQGSKILLSNLPMDVGETEIEVCPSAGYLQTGLH